jgi:tetratricopeptide (TPR) repeat protein
MNAAVDWRTPSESEARYDFTHNKLRSLVYEQTSLARRRLLHQRAAEVFNELARSHPETASLAAHHFQLAGQYALAATAYKQAGSYAQRLYANREAIAHFQNALACGHPESAALHEAIGDLQRQLGEYQAARASYETAAAQCSVEHLPWLEHRLGKVYHLLGDWDLAECHYQTALDELQAAPAPDAGRFGEQAQIYTDWSHTAYRRGDVEQARKLAGQSLRLAEEAQDHRALAQAHNLLGILERVNGQVAQALAHLQRSLEFAAKLDQPGPTAAALNNLARLYAQQGDLDRAVRLTEEALALCIQANDRHRAAALHNNLADLFHAAGNQEKAMEHLRQAVVIFAEIGVQAASPSEKLALDPANLSQADLADRLKPEIWKLSEW